MRGLGPLADWWSRLRSAWARNDGKPWEEWAPGVDLKEMVAIVGLVVAGVAMAFLTVLQVA